MMRWGLAAVILGLAGGAQAAALRCPGRMPGPHDGFTQVGPVPPRKLPLLGMRLFDGPPGEESRAAPAQLAPDEVTPQPGTRPGSLTARWRFAGGEHLLLVCDYRDTGSYYRRAATTLPHACSIVRGPDGIMAACE